MQKMRNTLFPMDGIVTNIKFTFDGDDMKGFTGEANFFLNEKEILLKTNSNLPPFKTPSHIVVAVEPADKGSLNAIACYIYNEGVLVDSLFGSGGLIFLLWILCSSPIMFLYAMDEFIASENFISTISSALFAFFSPLLFLSVIAMIPDFFKYRKALKVIDRRLKKMELRKLK